VFDLHELILIPPTHPARQTPATTARGFKPGCTSYESFKEITESGWALAWWCGDPDCESAITNETKATPRCIPLEQPKVEKAVCVHCGKPAAEKVYFAKAY